MVMMVLMVMVVMVVMVFTAMVQRIDAGHTYTGSWLNMTMLR